MTQPAVLPKCTERWCKNKARYTSPAYIDLDTGDPGPERPFCLTHKRIIDSANHRMLSNLRSRQKSQRIDELIPSLNDAIEHAFGPGITFTKNYINEVALTVEAAEKLLGRLA